MAEPIHVRVRLFAIQRELAGTREVALELPASAAVADAWTALVAVHPALAPGRDSVRFARNGDYADAATPLADGDEVAMIPPVSGGAGRADRRPGPGPRRILEVRGDALGPAPSWASSSIGWPRTAMAPRSGSWVGPGPRPGRPRRARRRRPPGTPAGPSSRSSTRPTSRWPCASWRRSPTRSPSRFGVERLAIVHRTGEVPLGEVSIAVVAVAAHRGDAFDAARYAIDETKARAPIWKAERFADGHVWIGHPARTGPEPTPRAED